MNKDIATNLCSSNICTSDINNVSAFSNSEGKQKIVYNYLHKINQYWFIQLLEFLLYTPPSCYCVSNSLCYSVCFALIFGMLLFYRGRTAHGVLWCQNICAHMQACVHVLCLPLYWLADLVALGFSALAAVPLIGIFNSQKCDVNPQPNIRGIGPLVSRTSGNRHSVMHIWMHNWN